MPIQSYVLRFNGFVLSCGYAVAWRSSIMTWVLQSITWRRKSSMVHRHNFFQNNVPHHISCQMDGESPFGEDSGNIYLYRSLSDPATRCQEVFLRDFACDENLLNWGLGSRTPAVFFKVTPEGERGSQWSR